MAMATMPDSMLRLKPRSRLMGKKNGPTPTRRPTVSKTSRVATATMFQPKYQGSRPAPGGDSERVEARRSDMMFGVDLLAGDWFWWVGLEQVVPGRRACAPGAVSGRLQAGMHRMGRPAPCPP